jgi:hypothetical protein
MSVPYALHAKSANTITGEIIQDSLKAPSLLNSWVNYGFDYDSIGYYKDKEGVIHFNGVIKAGTNTILFVLPLGYRPSHSKIMLAPYSLGTGSKEVGLIYINNITGSVEFRITTGSGIPDWISLDNVSFRQ